MEEEKKVDDIEKVFSYLSSRKKRRIKEKVEGRINAKKRIKKPLTTKNSLYYFKPGNYSLPNFDDEKELKIIIEKHLFDDKKEKKFYSSILLNPKLQEWITDIFWLLYSQLHGLKIRKKFFRKMLYRMGENTIQMKYCVKKMYKINSIINWKKDDKRMIKFVLMIARLCYKIFRACFPNYFFSYFWRESVYLYLKKWILGEFIPYIFSFERDELNNFSRWRIDTRFKRFIKSRKEKRSLKRVMRNTLVIKKFAKKVKMSMSSTKRQRERDWKNLLKDTKVDHKKKLGNILIELDKKLKSVKKKNVTNKPANNKGVRFKNLKRVKKKVTQKSYFPPWKRRASLSRNLPNPAYNRKNILKIEKIRRIRSSVNPLRAIKRNSTFIDAYRNSNNRINSSRYYKRLSII